MIQLQPANAMLKVSNDGFAKFKEAALESVYFKTLIQGIEKSAEDGMTSYRYILKQDEDKRMLDIFSKELEAAGYTVSKQCLLPMDDCFGNGIYIYWGNEQSDNH